MIVVWSHLIWSAWRLSGSEVLVLVPKTATDVIKSVAQFLKETSPSAVKLDRKRGDGTQTIPAGSQQI